VLAAAAPMVAVAPMPPARTIGTGAAQVIVLPARGRPRAVVVYIHGWADLSPAGKPWLVHLRQRGDTVVYPRYQVGEYDSTQATVAHLRAGLQRAFSERSLRGLPVLTVGYSWGAKLVFDYAVNARRWRVPVPRAVMSVFQPSLYYGGPPRGTLPPGTRVLLLSGDRDNRAASWAYRSWLASYPTSLLQFRLVRSRGAWLASHDAPARSDGRARSIFWAPLDALVSRFTRSSHA
jgi:alpha-beta hydrolase superfamily lysophospholipase